MAVPGAVRLFEVGRRVAAHHAATGAVDAVVVAGSVGRGLADTYSDLELDVYWSAPPTDDLRRAVIDAAGGTLHEFWAYEPDEGEWSETFAVDGCEVGVSGYTSSWMTSCLDRAVVRYDPWLLGQLRIAAVLSGVPVFGAEVVDAWRDRALPYPDRLAVAACTQALRPDRLSGWHQRHALVARDDVVFLRALCVAPVEMILHALCAVNAVYLPHPGAKWTTWLTRQLSDAPSDLDARLRRTADGPAAEAVGILDDLLDETVHIVERRLPDVDVTPLRRSLSAFRSASGPTP